MLRHAFFHRCNGSIVRAHTSVDHHRAGHQAGDILGLVVRKRAWHLVARRVGAELHGRHRLESFRKDFFVVFHDEGDDRADLAQVFHVTDGHVGAVDGAADGGCDTVRELNQVGVAFVHTGQSRQQAKQCRSLK